ncbi:MAG: hypothetical protein JWM20_300 [Patescibacteria group bacterium]|nr:hypothetical protein [Patescibacteria group bacterium]
MSPDEAAEAIKHLKSIPEKMKLLEDQMRAIDEKGAQGNNAAEHARLGEVYSQFEIMKRSVAETVAPAEEASEPKAPAMYSEQAASQSRFGDGSAQAPDYTLAQQERILNKAIAAEEKSKARNAAEEEAAHIPPEEPQAISFEGVPTITGDEKLDDILREGMNNPSPANPDADIANAGIVTPPVIPSSVGNAAPTQVNPQPPVQPVIATPVQPAAVVAAPAAQPAITAAPTMANPGNSNPLNAAPTAVTTVSEDPKVLEARRIAEKIKTHPHGTMALDEEEEKFRRENYDLLSQEMIKLNTPAKAPEREPTEAELHSEKLQRTREDYIKALFNSRKNPGVQDDKEYLKSLEDKYNQNLDEGIAMIRKESTDPKLLLDSMLDERRAYNKEMRAVQIEDVRNRIAKTLEKAKNTAGNVMLYSILLTGKLIGDGIDLARKGMSKLMSGNGLEKLKKTFAEMKAKSGDPDDKTPWYDKFVTPVGKRPFEQGNKEQQEAKKKADAEKRSAELEKKKTDNGAPKRSPEEIAKGQMKDFLATAFASKTEGKQLSPKEEKEASKAWETLKNIPLHMFMEPEKADWGKNKATGTPAAHSVNEYSTAQQGLHGKLKDAYEEAVQRQKVDEKTTLEEFIKTSIQNGSLK